MSLVRIASTASAFVLMCSVGCLLPMLEIQVNASVWTGGTASWSSNANPGWNGTGVPNSPGAVATRTAASPSVTTTQDIAGGVTVGIIENLTGSNNSWNFTNTNGITLNNSGNGAIIRNTNANSGTNNRLFFDGGTLTLADSLTLNAVSGSGHADGPLQISSAFSGTGRTITREGTGVITLSGNSSGFTGGNVVVNGSASSNSSLRVTNSGALGANNLVTLNPGTVGGSSGNNISLRGGVIIPSTVGLKMVTTESDIRVALASDLGSNTWAGPIEITGSGIAQFYATAASSTFNINGNITSGTFNGTLSLRGNTTLATGAINGTVTLGATSVVSKGDSSTWQINSSGNTWGSTIVSRSKLMIGANNALPVTAPLQVGEGANEVTFELNGFNQTVANLTTVVNGSNARTITNSSATPSVFTINNSSAGAYNGVGAITGNLALVKSGTAMLTIGGTTANTYTGGNTVNNGTLQLTAGAITALGATAAPLTVNGGVLDLNENNPTVGLFSGTGGTVLNNGAGTAVLTAGNAANGTFAGILADNGGSGGALALAKTGAGVLVLSGANTYTGDTSINAGKIEIANSSALGSGTGAGGNAAPGWTSIGGDGSSTAALALSNNISSAEVLYLSPRSSNTAPQIINESGNNTLSGTIAISDGDLTGPSNFTFQSDADLLTISGSVQQDLTGTATLTLRGAGNGTVSGSIEQPGTNFYYSTPVTGNVCNVAKEDAGVWTLSGVNSYTGTTAVNDGTLLVNGSMAAASTVTVASGATLGGNGTIGGSVTVNGIYAPGNSIDQQDLGALTISSIGTWEVEFDGLASPAIDLTDVVGAITLADGATISFVGLGDALTQPVYVFATYGDFIGNPQNITLSGNVLNNYYVDYSYNNNSIALVQIPEPCAMALVVIGVSGVGIFRRRRGC